MHAGSAKVVPRVTVQIDSRAIASAPVHLRRCNPAMRPPLHQGAPCASHGAALRSA